ncbi:MAG TPA: hypothetical protein VGQ41_24590 [Pyrinomonadaceae bacterium]|nr:hypothetical protein [Pyrinomonadaceae bacterium]
MINDYSRAVAIELGNAQDIVLGEKVDSMVIDNQTLEFGTRYIPATDD